MKKIPNQLYNKNVVTQEDLEFLGRIENHELVIFSNESVRLLLRGILEEVGYHDLRVTLRGKLLLRNIAVGATVYVHDSYHLPFMHGKVGTVVNIRDSFIDADGVDEYGYTIHRKKPITCTDVVFPDEPGCTWCFYKTDDLYGQWSSLDLENGFFRYK